MSSSTDIHQAAKDNEPEFGKINSRNTSFPPELLLEVLNHFLLARPSDAQLSLPFSSVIPPEFRWQTNLPPYCETVSIHHSRLRTIRQVCHYWNRLAISQPSWWIDIDVSSPPSWVSTMISRAGNEPLHLIGYAPTQAFKLMMASNKCITSMTVPRPPPSSSLPTRITSMPRFSMESLRTLQFDADPRNLGDPLYLSFNFEEVFHCTPPDVTSLFLTSTKWPLMRRSLSDLQVLSLESFVSHSNSVYQILRNFCVRLRVLRIRLLELRGVLVIPRPTTFQNLSALILDHVPVQFLQILSDFILCRACTHLFIGHGDIGLLDTRGHLVAFLNLFKQIWITQSQLSGAGHGTNIVLHKDRLVLTIGSAVCEFAFRNPLLLCANDNTCNAFEEWILEPCLASVSHTTLDLASAGPQDCQPTQALMMFLDRFPRICQKLIISGDVEAHFIQVILMNAVHDLKPGLFSETVTLEFDYYLQSDDMDILQQMIEERGMSRLQGAAFSLQKIIVCTDDPEVASALRDMFVRWKELGIDGSLREVSKSVDTL